MTRPYARPTVFTPPRAWTDEELLTMLHLHDHEGLSDAKVAAVMGTTKGAVIGLRHRIREANAKHPGDAGDGTMEPGWWRAREAEGHRRRA